MLNKHLSSGARLRRAAESAAAILILLCAWQAVAGSGLLPPYMLPGPVRVARALFSERALLARHLGVTLFEAAAGLALSVAAAFFLALVMDTRPALKRALGPLILLSQTTPAVAVAPLLALWLGFGAAPKIALVFTACFFPLTVSLLSGFDACDAEAQKLLEAMGASRAQVYRYLKLPASLGPFFAGLRIAASYALVGALVSEWLGGNAGLGVYMIRARKSYAFDRMFAVLVVVAALSLLLLRAVSFLERRAMPWRRAAEYKDRGGRHPSSRQRSFV